MPIFSSTIQDLASNKMPQPYYRFDGSNDSVTLTAGHNSNVGSFEVWFLHEADTGSGTYQFIFTDANSNFELAYTPASSGTLTFYVANSGLGWSGYSRDDDWHHVVGTFDVSGNSKKLYFDGDLVANTTCSTGTNGSNQYVGSRGGSYPWRGQISSFRYFNNALSATEVKERYSGASVPFKYKGANQTNLTTNGGFDSDSGWTKETGWSISGGKGVATGPATNYGLKQTVSGFTIGKRYRMTTTISDYVQGGLALEVVGSSSTITSNGTHSFDFTATATSHSVSHNGTASTPTLKVDNTTIVQIGAVAEYDGSGIASDKWFDKSGNDLHGTVNGATVENAPSGDSGLVYEEGSWTPTNNGTGWSHSQGDTNTYVRVGKMVTLYVYLQLTNGSSEQMDVAGLPFVSASNNYTSSTEMNHGTNAGQYSAHYRLYGGASVMYLHRTDTGAELYADNFNGTHQVFSITYKCA